MIKNLWNNFFAVSYLGWAIAVCFFKKNVFSFDLVACDYQLWGLCPFSFGQGSGTYKPANRYGNIRANIEKLPKPASHGNWVVLVYIEKGNSLSVGTGFLVELVSSWTRAKCKHYTSIAVFKTNRVLQKSRLNLSHPKKQGQSYYEFSQIGLPVSFSNCNE